ncbi:hypothetical protein J6590_031507 [Homalodisca vitripennis]|nr:hypothetical protein J6590_031507 [Homalodisca vitripennis]
MKEIRDICSTLPGFEQCDKDDAMEWLAVDSNDPGYQILTDQEIADMLNEEETKTMESDSHDPEHETEETGAHSETFVAAETLMSWLEKRKESPATQQILLKRIKDLATKKRTTTAVQKPITHLFKSSNSV